MPVRYQAALRPDDCYISLLGNEGLINSEFLNSIINIFNFAPNVQPLFSPRLPVEMMQSWKNVATEDNSKYSTPKTGRMSIVFFKEGSGI